MAGRHAGIGAALVLALGLLSARGADARVGDTVEGFEAGPMVSSGQVAFLEPFTIKNKAMNGVTYRATSAYKKACQVMLVVKSGKIESEIFAIPVVGDPEVLQAERELLDSFLAQSGIPEKYHAAIREHMVEAMESSPAPRKMGTHMVQALMIPAEVPLLVIAVAKDSATLPFPKPAIQPQAEQ